MIASTISAKDTEAVNPLSERREGLRRRAAGDLGDLVLS